MAGRNISIRLDLEGALELKQQLEGAGNVGGVALEKLRAGIERLGAQDSGAVVQAMQRITQAAQQAQAAVGQAQANSFAGVQSPSSTVDYKSRSADLAAYGASMDALRAKYNPLFAASKAYESTLDEIASAEKVGAISAAEAAAARDRVTASFAQSQAPLKAASAALKDVTTTSGAAAASMRGLGIQVVQGISGIATGQPVLTTFIQQGHQVVDQSLAMGTGFGGIATAAKGLVSAVGGLPVLLGGAVVGALVAVGVAANENAAHMSDLRQSLRLTHDDYASLADAVDASAKRVSAGSALTKSAAEDIGKTISSARYLGSFGQDLDSLTKSAANFARVAGVDGAAAGKLFRQAIDDPAAAAKALADLGLPALDAALLRTVQNLANTGQYSEATRLIFEAVGRGTKGATDDLTPVGKALHELEQRFYGARDGGKSFADVVGGAFDTFIAHELHGLDQLIEGLERFATKAVAAGKKVSSMSAGGGIVGADGMPVDVVGTPAAAPTASGSLKQVDASIQALLQDSAKQHQVDTELLARLQLVENRTPSGRDASGNAIYPSSPTGAAGPMQVTGSTFRGMPEFAGQNINDNATNIDAGTSLFAKLLKKYGDPYMAVLAYHDGETLIDKVLSGALDSNGNSYQASIAGKEEAVKVTAGYTGRGYLGVTGGSPSPNDVGGFIAGKGAASTALPESAQRALGTGSDGTQFANAQDAAASVEKYTKAIIDMHAAGQDSGPTMDRLQALLSKAREAAYGAVTPFENLTRAAQDQLGPLQAQSGAARTVAEAVNQATIALKSHGEDITSAQADQVRTDALTKLGLAFNDNVAAIDRQIDAQDRINAKYVQSGGNIAEVTARTQAEASARETAIPGQKDYSNQVAILTNRYLQLANSQKDLAQIQQNRGVSDNIAYIQKETDTLGMNEDARTRVLAVMKAEQDQHAKYGPILDAEQQHYVDLIGKQADYTASLKNQQASLTELTGFVDNTFSTISDSIVSAFATGEQSAVKFKDVAASVVKAVEAEFLKLAVINPLKDLLLGSASPNILSVGGVLGKLLGNDSSSSSSGTSLFDGPGVDIGSSVSSSGSSGLGLSDVAGAAGTLGTLGKAADYLTGGHLVSDLSSGIKDTFSQISNTSFYSSAPTAGGLTVPAGAADDVATATGSVANPSGSLNGVNVSVGSAVGIVGGLYGAYSGFERGGVGGTVQGIGGIASAGVAAAGAGLLGSGAAGLAAAAGPYAPIALAAIAIIGALLPGAHPIHPFQDTEVDATGGRLTVGKTVSQVESTAAAVQSVTDYSSSLDQFLTTAGLKLTNLDGVIGHIGENVTGLAQVSSPDALFSKLSFGNDPSDTSNFGVSKGALQGMSFATIQDLGAELQKIAAFSDAASLIGLKLQSVSTDLTNIQIASVTPNAAPATTTIQNAQGADVTFDSDLRQALQSDLPGKTFGTVQALDDEIASVSSFITQTLPQLLTPTKATQSSLQDTIQASNQRYADAIGHDQALGLGNTAVLSTARDQAIAILMKPALDALNTSLTSIAGRGQTLLYGQAGSGQAALANLAQTQNNEQSQLYDTIHQTFGDNAVATGNFNAALQQLLATQKAETYATLLQATTARDQSVSTLAALEASYAQRAGVNDEAAQLAAQDAKAAVERDQFYAAWIDTYGQLSTASQAFQDQLVIVDAAHAADRLAIEKNYVTQSNAALTQAQGSVASLFGSIKDYALKLETGSQSALSPLSQYDLAKSQFNAVSGAALAGDATSAQQLTTYADALLSTSQAANGSGAAYAADYSKVLDVLQGISTSSDTLTQSFMAQQLATQTDTLVASISSLQGEVTALRREVQLQTQVIAA